VASVIALQLSKRSRYALVISNSRSRMRSRPFAWAENQKGRLVSRAALCVSAVGAPRLGACRYRSYRRRRIDSPASPRFHTRFPDGRWPPRGTSARCAGRSA